MINLKIVRLFAKRSKFEKGILSLEIENSIPFADISYGACSVHANTNRKLYSYRSPGFPVRLQSTFQTSTNAD